MSTVPAAANSTAGSAQTSHAAALAANLKEAAKAEKSANARVYYSNMLTMKYIFKAGKVAAFLTKNGRTSEYTTNIKHEIEELDAEIELGHPNITSSPEETVAVIEPVEALRQKHFEEFKKMMEKATLKTNDAGTSDQGKLNVANSTSIAEASAGSDSYAATAPAPTTPVRINIAK